MSRLKKTKPGKPVAGGPEKEFKAASKQSGKLLGKLLENFDGVRTGKISLKESRALNRDAGKEIRKMRNALKAMKGGDSTEADRIFGKQ